MAPGCDVRKEFRLKTDAKIVIYFGTLIQRNLLTYNLGGKGQIRLAFVERARRSNNRTLSGNSFYGGVGTHGSRTVLQLLMLTNNVRAH